MEKKYTLSLYIFRRDLRLEDNTALIQALKESKWVIPCFIFDDRQLINNPYKSEHAVAFMINSIKHLYKQLTQNGGRLFVFKGIAEDVVERLIHFMHVQAVYFNRDYTPFSKLRDLKIQQICNAKGVNCQIYADVLLNEPETVVKKDNSPYTVYTHYLQKALLYQVSVPQKNIYTNYYTGEIPSALDIESVDILSNKKRHASFLQGGRSEALHLLDNIKNLYNYKETRNYPSLPTSHLSAHIKFGTVSIREVYYTAKSYLQETTFIYELYWRDFFTSIAWYFPHVFGQPFQHKYESIQWSYDEAKFERWKNGVTGFPIVDAGMRQLNATGWMHNRIRMITASFLVKDLHIDWQWGEKYFATKLIDYDPSVNNGNWQWAASIGCDAVPYFRVFNPWLQQKKYDPECIYIKQWIPELLNFSPNDIHMWFKKQNGKYPKPMLDHTREAVIAKMMFKIYKGM